MLILPSDTDIDALRDALEEAGFGPVEVDLEDDGLHVHGVSRSRMNEWGTPDNLEEADRVEVEAALANLSSVQQKRARARELRAKSPMSQSEQAEAIGLLLDLVLIQGES